MIQSGETAASAVLYTDQTPVSEPLEKAGLVGSLVGGVLIRYNVVFNDNDKCIGPEAIYYEEQGDSEWGLILLCIMMHLNMGSGNGLLP